MAEKSVRPAKLEEAAAVGDLVRASYSKYVERIGREPAPMLEDYAALIRAGEVWVLAEGGEVLGVLVMRPAEDHLFVDNVAVAPRHQGRGLGHEGRAAGGPALHQREDAREPGRLREAGLRGDRQAPRWRLPARLHAQAASLNGATGDRTAWVQGSLRGPYSFPRTPYRRSSE
jgi:GNAT superfamily N-acetyltransferase